MSSDGSSGSSASPTRNFTLSLDERIRGFGDPPAYSVRLRTIEILEERLTRQIEGAQTAHEVERVLRSGDIERLNRAIENHNRYFPIEANLPIDFATGLPRTRDGVFRPLPSWSRERLLQVRAQAVAGCSTRADRQPPKR